MDTIIDFVTGFSPTFYVTVLLGAALSILGE